MNVIKFLAPAALLGTLLTAGVAQADPPHYYHHGINARLARQNARIEQGERSGELTYREANHLERHDARIGRQEARMRLSGGRFTGRERARLQREENRTSGAIYRDKHNDRVR